MYLTYRIDVQSQFCCKYFLSPFIRIIESDLCVLFIARWTDPKLISVGLLVNAGRFIVAIKAGFNQRFPARTTFVLAEISASGIFLQWLMTITYRTDLYGFWSILCLEGILQFLNVVNNVFVCLQSETLIVLGTNKSDIE